MKNIIIYSFIIIPFFKIIFSQNIYFEFLNFDEAVNYLNDVKYSKTDYDDMISNLITLLNNHYIYLDIAKAPPPPYKPVDVIQELKSINTINIKYYDFYQQVFTILTKL